MPCQVLFICLKSDGILSVSWWLVLLPVFVYMGFLTVQYFAWRSFARSIPQPTNPEDIDSPEAMVEDQINQIRKGSAKAWASKSASSLCCFLL